MSEQEQSSGRWERAFRAIAPGLPTDGLVALKEALLDPKHGGLCRSSIVLPYKFMSSTDSDKVEKACAIGYCLWKGFGLQKASEIEAEFHSVCRKANYRLNNGWAGEFLNWFDSKTLEETSIKLVPVIDSILAERKEIKGE